MSFGSKKTLVSLIGGIVLCGAYIFYALGPNSPESDNLKSWAIAMLVFIGIGIVLIIVIQILFHIIAAIGIAVKERNCDDKKIDAIISVSIAEDERDKLIGLKSARAGHFFTLLGFIAALIAFAIGFQTLFALHILAGSFSIASVAE